MLSYYGVLSLIPTLTVLISAIKTKKVIEPLLAGCFLAYLLLDGINFIGGIVGGIFSVFQGSTFPMIASVTLVFGVFIELLEKSKAATSFSYTIGKKVKTEKASLFAAWLLGIAIFIDDFLNAIVVGTTMKKVTDRYNVPREMLAYIVDVTSAPMAVLLPFSAWAVFFMSLFVDLGLTELLGITEFNIYWRVVPYMFYPIIAIGMVPLVICKIIPPLGAMKKAYSNKGKHNNSSIDNEDTGNAKPYHFIIPILILVVSTFVFGGDVLQGSILATIVTIIMFSAQHLIEKDELPNHISNGVINMLSVTGIIFFSLLLVEGNVRLGTTDFVIQSVSGLISAELLPAITFIIVLILSFSTGSFFGTSAIVLPIIVPMAVMNESNIYLSLGAVISGATFGSHICFFGDATVLSAKSCDVTPMDHALTQLPYGIIAAAVAFILYIIMGYLI